MENKTLKFTSSLVPMILSGEKTVTWRINDDKNLQKNDHLILINKDINTEFAEADIENVNEKKLGDFKDEDYEGHEKFIDHEEMLRTYRKYYGDEVNDQTIVKIIHFKLK